MQILIFRNLIKIYVEKLDSKYGQSIRTLMFILVLKKIEVELEWIIVLF